MTVNLKYYPDDDSVIDILRGKIVYVKELDRKFITKPLLSYSSTKDIVKVLKEVVEFHEQNPDKEIKLKTGSYSAHIMCERVVNLTQEDYDSLAEKQIDVAKRQKAKQIEDEKKLYEKLHKKYG